MNYVELKKSYRSSYEIIDFTKRFLPEGAIEAIERHGEEPEVIQFEDLDEQGRLLIEQLKAFQNEKMRSCGIVCKTEEQVAHLRVIVESFNGHVLDESSTSFNEGITLTTVQLAKGLEFDQVIVPFVDAKTYHNDFDKGLLYVACTRALHQLTLLQHKQQPSPLI